MAGHLWSVVAGVLVLLAGTGAQQVPTSPCPSVFHYEIGSAGSWQGILRVPSPKPNSPLKVKVVMDIKAKLPSNYYGKLVLIGDKDDIARGITKGRQQEVQYRVLFPLENPLPIMRSVTANGNVICTGPKVVAPYVTTITLDHTFETYVVPHTWTGVLNPSRPSEPEWPVGFDVVQTVAQNLPSSRPRPTAQLAGTGAPQVPTSRCPSIFRYEIGPTGSWQGILHVPVPEPKNTIQVNVGMTIKARLPSNYYGKLVLIGDKDDVARGIMQGRQREVQYRVLFPLEYPLPIMRSVTVNGNVICSGPKVDTSDTSYVTTISLYYTFYSYGFNQPDPQQPTSPTVVVSQPEWPVIETVPEAVPPPRPRPTEVVPPPRPRPTEVAPIPRPTDPLPPPSTDYNQCGQAVQVSALVVKGEPSKPGEWPWLGAVYHYNDNGGVDYVCSSTLINNRHIVTAAHCLWKDGGAVSPDAVVVLLGKYNLQNLNEPGSQNMQIKEVFIHNDYIPGNLTADIAVLQFKLRVTFTVYIRPICLWNQSPDIHPWINKRGTVVGWGRDEKGNDITPEPRMIRVPIVAYDKCLNSNKGFLQYTSDRTFCAGARDGSGPCNGDSGSGFVLPVGDSWYLRGIVSLSLKTKGTLTCNLQEYIVYTDVAKFQDWLQPHMIR